MSSRYKFFENVWNNELQHTQKGFLMNDIVKNLKEEDYIIYSVTMADQYRPDLISHKFYGTGRLYWVLVYVNDIYNSPEGFEIERRIKIPNPRIIGTLI